MAEHFIAWQQLEIEAGKRLTLMSAVPNEEEDTLQLQLTTDMGAHVIMNCPGSIDQPGFFYIECNKPWTTYLNDWTGDRDRLFEAVLTKMTQLMDKFVEVKPLALRASPLPTKLESCAFSEGDI